MALWSGRFEEGMSDFALKWGASLQDDKIMASQDIAGSIAHATMLAKNGIISEEDIADLLAEYEKLLNVCNEFVKQSKEISGIGKGRLACVKAIRAYIDVRFGGKTEV